MATYTFHDLKYDVERQSTLSAVRALFVLARHDIESKVLYEPIAIEHNGKRYTKEDIVRLTEYKHGYLVKVLLPDEEAAA